MKKSIPEDFAKFIGKHAFLIKRFFLNKGADVRTEALLKKIFWHRYFPVNFAKFLRVPFLQNTSGRLLLINLSTVNK